MLVDGQTFKSHFVSFCPLTIDTPVRIELPFLTMAPNTQQRWVIQGKKGFESLVYSKEASIPKVGDSEVLVKCKYISEPWLKTILNYDPALPCKYTQE